VEEQLKAAYGFIEADGKTIASKNVELTQLHAEITQLQAENAALVERLEGATEIMERSAEALDKSVSQDQIHAALRDNLKEQIAHLQEELYHSKAKSDYQGKAISALQARLAIMEGMLELPDLG
jgi:hypothetical protein